MERLYSFSTGETWPEPVEFLTILTVFVTELEERRRVDPEFTALLCKLEGFAVSTAKIPREVVAAAIDRCFNMAAHEVERSSGGAKP